MHIDAFIYKSGSILADLNPLGVRSNRHKLAGWKHAVMAEKEVWRQSIICLTEVLQQGSRACPVPIRVHSGQ